MTENPLRKGPTMEQYREDLRRFGPPPRYSLAERLATLSTGYGAVVTADAEDGTDTLVKVKITSVDFDASQLHSAAAVLKVGLVKESSSGDLRWYRVVRS
jgi:hypothetical protein